MAHSLIYVNTSNLKTPEDADLGTRVVNALTTQKRAGWHEVYISIRSGQVTLNGVVASARERKLVAAVTSRVPGVFRIKDELTIDEKYLARSASGLSSDAEEFAAYEIQQKAAKRAEQFRSLPVTSESLEDILAARSKGALYS